jgi:hypothetical protein
LEAKGLKIFGQQVDIMNEGRSSFIDDAYGQ